MRPGQEGMEAQAHARDAVRWLGCRWRMLARALHAGALRPARVRPLRPSLTVLGVVHVVAAVAKLPVLRVAGSQHLQCSSAVPAARAHK